MASANKIKNNRMKGSSAVGRRGFTLIETMLAVGILLILSLVIYQGFSATIKYSWNTTRFEKSLITNAGAVNQKLAGSTIGTPTPSVGIYLSWNGGANSKVLGGQQYAITPLVGAINLGDSSYQESTSLASTHQYGFSYLPKRCPTDGSEMTWYTKGGHYWLVCPLNAAHNIDMGVVS